MSLAAYGGQILQQAADIARQIARRESTRLRWATVTSTDPLLIRYDGEAEASVVPPQTLAACTVGDRVRVAVYRGQATILGVAGQHPNRFNGSAFLLNAAFTATTGYGFSRSSGLIIGNGTLTRVSGHIGSNWVHIGTLAEGYRPSTSKWLNTNGSGVFMQANVEPDGRILVRQLSSAQPTNVVLDPLIFPAAT